MMESFGLGEELSLFGGDLLLGLDSPIDEQSPGLEDEFLFKPPMPEMVVKRHATTSDFVQSQQLEKDQHSLDLGSNWLDVKIDLHNVVGTEYLPQPEITVPSSCASVSQEMLISSPAVASMQQFEVVVDTSDTADETDVLALLDSFACVPSTPENACSTPLSSLSSSAVPTIEDNSELLMEVLSKLTDAMSDDSLVESQSVADVILSQPVLSPVSVEDVESLLSSSPASPGEGSVVELFDLNPENETDLYSSSKSLKQSKYSSSKRMLPIEFSEDEDDEEFVDTSNIKDKKLRKKMQNKNAALRYRQKKRAEANGKLSECDKIEQRNQELKDKVDSMTREIDYLKNLMLEVFDAKKTKGLMETKVAGVKKIKLSF